MKSVLIIEDDLEVVEVYKSVLEKKAFQVFVAYSGTEGLEIAKKNKPGLILLDIMMPGMDGLEVLKRLKSDNETDLIPVVVLTNVGVEYIQAEALSLGAVRYIVKTDVVYDKFVEQIEAFVVNKTEA